MTETGEDLELSEQERQWLEDPYCRRLIKERFYRWLVSRAIGKRLDWKLASTELEGVTGTHIHHDTLRQNFHAVSRQQGSPRREFKELDRWAALYRFVTDEAIGYLSTIELVEEVRPIAGLLALQDFIALNNDDVFPSAFTGRFTSLWDVKQIGTAIITIDMDTLREPGAVRAVMREEAIGVEDDMTDILSYQGAAVWSGDLMILVLKDQVTGSPRIGLIAQAKSSEIQKDEIESLALWLYEGLSAAALTTKMMYTEVDDDKDKSLDTIEYTFDGEIGRIFLTRC